MSRLSSVQEDTQQQLREMGTPQIKVPTAESVPGYARSFTAAPSGSVGDGLSEMMSQLEAKQADTQSQLSGMGKQPRSVPGPESAPSFVKSEFRAPAPSQPAPSEQPSIQQKLRSAGIGMSGVPEEYYGTGVGIEVESLPGGQKLSLSSPQAAAQLKRAGVTPQEAESYWMGKLESMGALEERNPSYQQPQGRKITVTEIEEPAPVQQSMKPMDVAERLRRIQTSGRPTARQEAQDFLASIKSQMSNG